MLDAKKIVAGAVAGFVSALVIDVNAWSKTDLGTGKKRFDWMLAFKRWVAGAVSGVVVASGLGQL